ncbi:helix-turn-helix transcriptional regulator [Escherichia coli]|nr:helix-turn-helix transcriptional regulator [Escherichia coli]
MASALYTSESSLRRRLKEENYTFTQLTLDTKMKNALQLLEHNTGKVGFVAKCLGYTSEAYFISVFKRYFNMTPKQFYLKINSHTKLYISQNNPQLNQPSDIPLQILPHRIVAFIYYLNIYIFWYNI